MAQSCSDVRAIPLSKGKVALVDAVDYAIVAAFKWHALHRGNCWHAARTVKHAGTRRTVYMHRLILAAPAGVEVDHANGDGLDNRRANLRLCSKRENGRNRRQLRRPSKTSRYHGVCFKRQFQRWDATICAGPLNERGHAKQIYLGRFTSEEAAARAYDRAALKHFGRFAVTNFPRNQYDAGT